MTHPDPTNDAPEAPAAAEVPAANPTYIWWEKTVEYAFVRNILPSAADAFPLAGDVEKSFGDLLIQDGTRCRLIEFKRNKAAIQREKEKFPAFASDAADENVKPGRFFDLFKKAFQGFERLGGSDAHFFVYGHPKENTFQLRAQRYASDPAGDFVNLTCEGCLKDLGSTTAEEMQAYLRKLDEVRGSWLNSAGESGEGGGSGGGGGGASIAQSTTPARAAADEKATDEPQPTSPIPTTFVLVSVPNLGGSMLTAAEFLAIELKPKPKNIQAKKPGI